MLHNNFTVDKQTNTHPTHPTHPTHTHTPHTHTQSPQAGRILTRKDVGVKYKQQANISPELSLKFLIGILKIIYFTYHHIKRGGGHTM